MSTKITALYARNALADPEKINAQMEAMKAYAAEKGFKNIRCYADDGYSGVRINHPSLSILLKAARENKVEVLIVNDLSRLCRDYTIVSDLLQEFQKLGVRFIAIKEQVDNLPPRIHDDDNGLDYELIGDYYFPDLHADDEDEDEDLLLINKWGRMREAYLKEHRLNFYERLCLTGKLHDHLAEISDAADRRENSIIERHKKQFGITEQTKAEDQMKWVCCMMIAQSVAREVICDELIYN